MLASTGVLARSLAFSHYDRLVLKVPRTWRGMKNPQNSESKDDGKVVQRGDSLSVGTRRGGDRRGDARGLNAGRRMSDHRRVRTAFLDRIKDMLAIGISPTTVARILHDEESTTAQGEAWTNHD